MAAARGRAGAPIGYLTQEMAGVTGGRLLLQDDPVKAAEAIEAHIVAKREALGFDA